MTDTTLSTTRPAAVALRRLYLVRFVFAVLWAIALLATAAHPGGLLTAILVIYPLADAVAVLWQLRTSGPDASSRVPEWINLVMSVVAAIALGVTSTASIGAAIATWGVWATVSGATQLVTALLRRRTGGQIPLVISGGISVFAGIAFLVQGLGAATSAAGVGGYAILGGVFFLIAAIRLSLLLRAAR